MGVMWYCFFLWQASSTSPMSTKESFLIALASLIYWNTYLPLVNVGYSWFLPRLRVPAQPAHTVTTATSIPRPLTRSSIHKTYHMWPSGMRPDHWTYIDYQDVRTTETLRRSYASKMWVDLSPLQGVPHLPRKNRKHSMCGEQTWSKGICNQVCTVWQARAGFQWHHRGNLLGFWTISCEAASVADSNGPSPAKEIAVDQENGDWEGKVGRTALP